MCTSKKKGGLGIRNLTKLNNSLLGKWNCRFVVEDNPLWKGLINLKYGLEEGGWFSKVPKGRFGVGVWKDIRREAQQLKQDYRFILGNGGWIRFWEDKWCGRNLLCEMFPTLYALADSKGAMVGEVWNSTRGEGDWNLRFIGSFNDWELEESHNFISLINNSRVNQRERDKIFWTVDKKREYSVKACYRFLEGGITNPLSEGII